MTADGRLVREVDAPLEDPFHVALRVGSLSSLMRRGGAWTYLRNVVVFHLLWIAIGMSFDLVRQLASPSEGFIPQLYVALTPLVFVILGASLLPISIVIGVVVWWLARQSRLQRRLVALAVATGIWFGAITVGIGVGGIQPGPGFPLEVVVPACLIYGLIMPLPCRPDQKEVT